jgi:hypothetical protein
VVRGRISSPPSTRNMDTDRHQHVVGDYESTSFIWADHWKVVDLYLPPRDQFLGIHSLGLKPARPRACCSRAGDGDESGIPYVVRSYLPVECINGPRSFMNFSLLRFKLWQRTDLTSPT